MEQGREGRRNGTGVFWAAFVGIVVLGTLIRYGMGQAYSGYEKSVQEETVRNEYYQHTPVRWRAGDYYVSNIAENILDNLEISLRVKDRLDERTINKGIRELHSSVY